MLPFLLLGIIVTLALLVKDYALAGAACLLGVLLAVGQKLYYILFNNILLQLVFSF